MFPDKFLDKICFRTKPGIFPDSLEKISFTLEKFMEKNICLKKKLTNVYGKNMFLEKSGLFPDSMENINLI